VRAPRLHDQGVHLQLVGHVLGALLTCTGPHPFRSLGSAEALAERRMPGEMLGKLVMRSFVGKILVAVYAVVGLIVASSHHYLSHLGEVKPILSAVLAVLLWPLVLFGVKLHIR
jgi:hypothetical protein